jgi:hypothetical protein
MSIIKPLILKLLKRESKSYVGNKPSIYDTPIRFKTVEPDTKLSFDKWTKRYKVGKSFTLLEDTVWLQKVRKQNNIKSLDDSQPVYLIKNLWE